MRVAILGASGIIGQHMRLTVPFGVEAAWVRRNPDSMHTAVNLADPNETRVFLDGWLPDVVVNLAGENRPDVVEKSPKSTRPINVFLVYQLACWCRDHGRHYVHVSSQAVFDGEEPPYLPRSARNPINAYGIQKTIAEMAVQAMPFGWTIARATFVLGIRPFPDVGRPNPVEQMLEGQQFQVEDRWFSVAFANDCAQRLWRTVIERPLGILHIGISGCTSRYEIARKLGCDVEPASHNDFPGLAARPKNTAYGSCAPYTTELDDGLTQLRMQWEDRRRQIA